MLVTCSSDICVTVTSQSYVVLYMCVKPDPPQQLLLKTSSWNSMQGHRKILKSGGVRGVKVCNNLRPIKMEQCFLLFQPKYGGTITPLYPRFRRHCYITAGKWLQLWKQVTGFEVKWGTVLPFTRSTRNPKVYLKKEPSFVRWAFSKHTFASCALEYFLFWFF